MFQKGDIVQLTEQIGKLGLYIGSTGTVVGIEPGTGLTRVRWDLDRPNRGFHSCGGKCDQGYGFNVRAEYLELVNVCPVSEDIEILHDDLFSLLGGVC